MPSGAVYWSYKFYDPKANPNRQNASLMNNTWHLRVRYNTNGTYIMQYSGEDEPIRFDAVSDDWKEYFKDNIETLVLPNYEVETTDDGSLYTFLNDTQRLVYDEPETRQEKAINPLFDDIYPNGTVIRFYVNGSIGAFFEDESAEETFVRWVKAPSSLFVEKASNLYTSGTYEDFLWI